MVHRTIDFVYKWSETSNPFLWYVQDIFYQMLNTQILLQSCVSSHLYCYNSLSIVSALGWNRCHLRKSIWPSPSQFWPIFLVTFKEFIVINYWLLGAQVVHFKGLRKRLMLEAWNFFQSSLNLDDMLCLVLGSGRTKYDFWTTFRMFIDVFDQPNGWTKCLECWGEYYYDVSSQHIASSGKPLFWSHTRLIDDGIGG